jgi:hypothetical protein
MSDLAALLGVHNRTIHSWRKLGLRAIDESDRPLLFLGNDVKDLLIRRRQSGKRKLQPGQFYCVRCRNGRFSRPELVRFLITGKTMGKDNEQVLISGECQECGTRLNLFGTSRGLSNGFWSQKFKEAERRLYGNCGLPTNNSLEA